MSRILVTGGLGFIGSALTRRLLVERPGAEITVVDDQSGTLVDWSDLDQLIEVIVDDVRTLAPGRPFDEVWHLASPVGSVGILGAAGHIAGDIIDLAGHAHEIAAAAGATLLYVSSSEVYGRDGRHDECADLIVPDRRGARMEYAIGKLGAEHVLANRCADSGVWLSIVRPFNCAGPGQSEALGFVVPTFVRAALEGDPLPVHGDGSARRAFCHVDDMVDGFLRVAGRFDAGARSGCIHNVGQDRGAVTILELATRVIDRLASSSVIEFVDPAHVHGPHWLDAFDKIPDIGRITAETGWRPVRSLDDIIDDVAADLRSATADAGRR